MSLSLDLLQKISFFFVDHFFIFAEGQNISTLSSENMKNDFVKFVVKLV